MLCSELTSQKKQLKTFGGTQNQDKRKYFSTKGSVQKKETFFLGLLPLHLSLINGILVRWQDKDKTKEICTDNEKNTV